MISCSEEPRLIECETASCHGEAFACLGDGLRDRHGLWFHLVEEIEARFEQFSVFDDSSERGYGLTQCACHIRDTKWPLTMQSLRIHLALASDHQVRRSRALLQMHGLSYQVEATDEFGAAEAHQAKSKSSSRSRTWDVPCIDSEVTFYHRCQASESALEELTVTHALLRSIDLSAATLTE